VQSNHTPAGGRGRRQAGLKAVLVHDSVESTVDAIQLSGRLEGMIIDAVYEGKSMAGLVDVVRTGEIPRASTALDARLSGQPALNATSASSPDFRPTKARHARHVVVSVIPRLPGVAPLACDTVPRFAIKLILRWQYRLSDFFLDHRKVPDPVGRGLGRLRMRRC
jgi:hypothetical protein